MEKTIHIDGSKKHLYPSVQHMEWELVMFAREMCHGDKNVTGFTTTGGTDSIANAILAYKHWAREVKGITSPNLVIGYTTHLAFIWACQYYNIEFRIVPFKNFRYDVEKARQMIDENTIAICASASDYAYGIIDPIEEIA